MLVPLSAALVLVNGLHPGSVLLVAGVLVVVSGAAFGIPFPVQPLKALTAVAVALQLSPGVIHAAGLEIGALLVLLWATGLADRLSTLFTRPVIRSLQFAVGTLLVVTAARLVENPPSVFEHTPPAGWSLALAAATVVTVAIATHRRWYVLVVLLVGVGAAVSWMVAPPALGTVALHVPSLAAPSWDAFGTALVLLVIPQLPLTYGNAVVGVSHLSHELFGEQARRVSPGRVALSCGLGNLVAGMAGGMPMCHGSSGLSAHARLGARTPRMNLILGTGLVALGLAAADQVLALFGLLPVWALAGLLAYAGIRHAMLVLDLRGPRLAVAVGAGILGIVTSNLAYTTAAALAAALAAEHLGRLRLRPRGR